MGSTPNPQPQRPARHVAAPHAPKGGEPRDPRPLRAHEQNTPVLSFDYDLDDHKAVRIREVFAPEAAPFGLVDRRSDLSKAELNYWWRHRAIPSSRAQIKRLLENLQLESTLVLAERASGCRFPTATGSTTRTTPPRGTPSTSSTTTSLMTWDFSPWART